MNIIHINDKLEISGGVEIYIQDLMTMLNKKGIRSEWISINRIGKRVSIKSSARDWQWDGNVNSFRSSLKNLFGKDAIIHLHSMSDPILVKSLFGIAPVVRKAADPRMVCPGQGKFWLTSEEACSLKFGIHCFVKAYTKKCCNRHPVRLVSQYFNSYFETFVASKEYSAVIANSTYTQRILREAGINNNLIKLCHNFTPITDPPNWNGINRKRIVFVGRLSITKGVHFLLKSLQLVSKKVHGLKVDIVGSGRDDTYFMKLADELGLSDFVTFHGWCDRIKTGDVLNSACVMAFPSIYPEAFGISGIEAMMRGLPVVGFDVGGVSDWLKDGKTGFLVEPKDFVTFSDRLVQLLEDEELRKTMGKNSRINAEKYFSPEAHFSNLIQIYESCLTK